MTNSVENHHICARCGKPVSPPHHLGDDDSPRYCSFRCESAALFGNLKGGLKWFAVSLLWGLAILALVVVLARPVFGTPVANPVAYGGLVLVLAAIVAILSMVFRRVKL